MITSNIDDYDLERVAEFNSSSSKATNYPIFYDKCESATPDFDCAMLPNHSAQKAFFLEHW